MLSSYQWVSDHQNIHVDNNHYNLFWSSAWKKEEDLSASDLNTRKTGSDDEEDKMWSRKGKRELREREKRVSWQELCYETEKIETKSEAAFKVCSVFIVSSIRWDKCMKLR